MANYLINEGFKIKKISENKKKKGLNVFIFNGSIELKRAIEKWYTIET